MTPASPTGSAVVGSPDTRTITLPDSQRLLLRPVSAADAADLTRLHRTLTVDDEHLRCSSIARPAPGAVERIATVSDRGGFGLVATVSATRHDREDLLGVATYELLGDGDGALSLVVAREWRWWLQRLLLHAILEAAGRRDIPNLEADVKLTNQALLAFARSRGCAFMHSERPWSVRCLMGTRGPTPRWPGIHDRPRVLVETPTGGWRTDPTFVHPDWQVLVCPGPEERDCPTLGGQVCRLAAGADAIVVAPRPGDRHWSALTAAHRSQHPGVPVFVRSPAPGSGPGDTPGWLSAEGADGRADRVRIDEVARTHARRSDDWLGAVPPDRPEARSGS